MAKFKQANMTKEKGRASNGAVARMTKPSFLVEQKASKARAKRKARQKLNRKQKRLNPQRSK